MTASWKLAEQIMRTMQDHQLANFTGQIPGEIHISAGDAQALHDEFRPPWQGEGDVRRVLQVRDGDTGTLWGQPYRANKSLVHGEAFIGYRVAVENVPPDVSWIEDPEVIRRAVS